MNLNWLALFLTILPKAIIGIETVAADIRGHEKKAAVTHALTSLAEGVAAAAPQHAEAATIAAQTAVGAIDGVVKCIKAVQGDAVAQAAVAAPVPQAVAVQTPAAQPMTDGAVFGNY